jgi:hypothetical protein
MPPRHKHTDNVRTASKPAYGGLPTASEANRQRAEELREAARKKRKRNRMIGWYVALAIFVVIAAALAGAVYLFQSEDDGDDEVPATTVAGELTGAVGPLSEQVLTMEAAGEIAGGGLIPSAGAIGAIDQAQAAVDQLNGAGAAGTLPGGAASITFAEVTRQQVMPDMLAAISQLLPDAGDGLTRYLVDYPSWQQLDPQAAANWVVLLQALPQSPITVAMPPPGPGQVVVALASSSDVLTNLVAVGLTPAVSVQQPG